MALRSLKIKLKGTGPLLMHNERLANDLDPAAKALKSLTAKRKKTEEDHLEISQCQFKGALYCNGHGPYIPSHWILAMLRDSGKLSKRGRDVNRGVVLDELECPLTYKGPRDPDGLWRDKFVDQRMVRTPNGKVLRTRPRFDEWSVEFNLRFDDSVFDLETIAGLVKTGGQMIGLGDYRPMFGRFDATISKGAS